MKVNGLTESDEVARRDVRVTFADVAKAAGVSTATVSYVLSGRAGVSVTQPTRQRVMREAERLGYRRNSIASSLRKGETRTVAIVSTHLSGASVTRGNYVKDMMLALCVAASGAGLNVVMTVDKSLGELRVEDVTDRRVDGIVVFGIYGAEHWMRAVLRTGIPCVEINSYYGGCVVATDNALGARQGVEHLRVLGHRRIAYVDTTKETDSARLRRAGFCDAAASSGEPLLLRDWDRVPALVRSAAGPTGLVCYNDEAAAEMIDRLTADELRVPEDVSVVGFDNSMICDFVRPRLTSIENPVEMLAGRSLALLQRQIAGESLGDLTEVVPTRLVTRASVAAPAAGR